MCGICGIAYSDRRPVDRDALIRMRDSIAHRGPDGVGLWMSDGIGLGHRRLSIIDVQGGAQPIANEDETVWVIYNGEIYNFQELTSQLERLGHQFRTRSDTEVLVHAYEEFGIGFVSRLNGMFAFALYDVPRGRLVLARDHLGVKPLFYAQTGDQLTFASEIKAIRSIVSRDARTSRVALQEFLIFRYNAWDRTFYEGIKRLPPGHTAVWEAGKLTLSEYWSPPMVQKNGQTATAAIAELDSHLERSVAMQMISEVPLGSFCSGGVDSGLVSAYASRRSPHQLETFSVGFADPAWDETPLARDTAGRLGTRHYEVIAEPTALAELLPTLIHFNDEPLSQPNSAPLFLLSRLAREHVTVVLTGEGADEIFCGYPRFQIARLRGTLNGAGSSLLPAIAALGRASRDHRLRRLGDLLPRTLADVILFNSAFVSPELVERLTGESIEPALEQRRALVQRVLDSADAMSSMSRYDTLTYLPSLLERMDRMSMAHSLEGRVPFLDVPLVEWGLALPSSLRTPRGRPKWPVRRLAERFLSERITRGRKSGFGLPLAQWFRTPGFAPLLARIADGQHPAAAYFDRRVLREVVDTHLNGSKDESELLWLLTNFFLWTESNHAA